MQSISATQRAWIKRGGLIKPSVSAELADSITTVLIGSDDILENSLWVDRQSASGKKFAIGTAGTSELTFTLLNHSGDFTGVKFEGAILTLTYDLNGESLAGGIYIVDEKPQAGKTMKIRALDRMAKTNKLYDSTLEYPATLQEILTDACTRCGLSLYSSTFPHHTYLVTVHPEADATYHQVISWVAQLAGCEAFINVAGLLELKGYSGTVESIGDILDIEYAEDDVTVTGVEYETDEGIYLAGTETYTVDVTGNPFVLSDIAAVLGMINTLINGLTFRPITRFKSVALPYLWPMDRISFEDEGITYQSIITGIRTGHRSEIVAAGQPETIAGYASGGALTPKQKNIIKTIAKTVSSTDISALEIELLALNEQIANSLGYYTTVVTDGSGSQIVYHHDQPDLEDSIYIDIKPAAGAFAWTDQGWNDGDPVWQYGITQSGSLVMRIVSAVGVNADWITAGMLKSPDGSTYFDLDNAEIGMESNAVLNMSFFETRSPGSGKTIDEATGAELPSLYNGVYLWENDFFINKALVEMTSFTSGYVYKLYAYDNSGVYQGQITTDWSTPATVTIPADGYLKILVKKSDGSAVSTWSWINWNFNVLPYLTLKISPTNAISMKYGDVDVLSISADGYILAKGIRFSDTFSLGILYNTNDTAEYYYIKTENKDFVMKTLANVKAEIVTKAAIESSLTGTITSHTHSYVPLSGGVNITGNIALTGGAAITGASRKVVYLTTGSCDTITEEWTVIHPDVTNAPATGYWYMQTILMSTGDNRQQIAYKYNGSDMYRRYYYSSSWSSWAKIF